MKTHRREKSLTQVEVKNPVRTHRRMHTISVIHDSSIDADKENSPTVFEFNLNKSQPKPRNLNGLDDIDEVTEKQGKTIKKDLYFYHCFHLY